MSLGSRNIQACMQDESDGNVQGLPEEYIPAKEQAKKTDSKITMSPNARTLSSSITSIPEVATLAGDRASLTKISDSADKPKGKGGTHRRNWLGKEVKNRGSGSHQSTKSRIPSTARLNEKEGLVDFTAAMITGIEKARKGRSGHHRWEKTYDIDVPAGKTTVHHSQLEGAASLFGGTASTLTSCSGTNETETYDRDESIWIGIENIVTLTNCSGNNETQTYDSDEYIWIGIENLLTTSVLSDNKIMGIEKERKEGSEHHRWEKAYDIDVPAGKTTVHHTQLQIGIENLLTKSVLSDNSCSSERKSSLIGPADNIPRFWKSTQSATEHERLNNCALNLSKYLQWSLAENIDALKREEYQIWLSREERGRQQQKNDDFHEMNSRRASSSQSSLDSRDGLSIVDKATKSSSSEAVSSLPDISPHQQRQDLIHAESDTASEGIPNVNISSNPTLHDSHPEENQINIGKQVSKSHLNSAEQNRMYQNELLLGHESDSSDYVPDWVGNWTEGSSNTLIERNSRDDAYDPTKASFTGTSKSDFARLPDESNEALSNSLSRIYFNRLPQPCESKDSTEDSTILYSRQDQENEDADDMVLSAQKHTYPHISNKRSLEVGEEISGLNQAVVPVDLLANQSLLFSDEFTGAMDDSVVTIDSQLRADHQYYDNTHQCDIPEESTKWRRRRRRKLCFCWLKRYRLK